MRVVINVLFWLSALAIVIGSIVVLSAPPINPFLIYILLFNISTLLFLLISFTIQRTIWAALKVITNSVSSNRLSKLIGLGITSVVFVVVPNELIIAFMGFVVSLFSKVTENFSRIWEQRLSILCQQEDLTRYNSDHILSNFSGFVSTNCFSQIPINISRIWSMSISEAYYTSRLNYFAFDQLILFIVFWVLAVKIVDYLLSPPHFENFSKYVRAEFANSVFRSNVIFFAILGIGLYLSIASIAAIPSLQDSAEVSVVSSEKLQEQFSSLINLFKLKFPIEGGVINPELDPFFHLRQQNPFSELQALFASANITDTHSILAQVSESSNATNTIVIDQTIHQQLTRLIEQDMQDRSELIGFGQKLQTLSLTEMDRLAKSAIAQYEYTSTTRKGARETVEHFLLLTNWFNSRASAMDGGLTNCIDSIHDLDKNYERWSKLQISNLRSGALRQKQVDPYLYLADSIKQAKENSNDVCQLSIIRSSEVAPSRPALGAYLGPFSLVVSWLLRTESLPLALITGLIGFGLLGSAASSFVRERIEPSGQQLSSLIVQDLPKVIIIGLSAAILAFLAVMGGLAVFFSTGSDPNPYALLLGCLIASVFGEAIWKKARDELNKRLPKEPSTGLLVSDKKIVDSNSNPSSINPPAILEPEAEPKPPTSTEANTTQVSGQFKAKAENEGAASEQ